MFLFDFDHFDPNPPHHPVVEGVRHQHRVGLLMRTISPRVAANEAQASAEMLLPGPRPAAETAGKNTREPRKSNGETGSGCFVHGSSGRH